MIRAIFLDLGNVVLPFDNRRFFRKLAATSPLDEGEITQRYFDAPWQRQHECGAISSATFYREVSKLCEVSMDEARFFRAFNSVFDRKANVDFAFLHALAAHYKLLLLSNTNACHFEFVTHRFGLFRAFQERALSFQVGAAKPDPRIYEAALVMSGMPARETFYADDVEAFVEAGQTAGLQAAQVKSHMELIEQMAAHGIMLPKRVAEGAIQKTIRVR